MPSLAHVCLTKSPENALTRWSAPRSGRLAFSPLYVVLMPAHRYRLFGLDVVSELNLPDLFPTAGSGPVDVSITFGRLVEVEETGENSPQIGAGRMLLDIPEAGRYLITNGERIVVERNPGVSDRNVRLFLLGSAFGAILHQRGLLPLHANVIDFGGAAVAFMGHSGAGKSTLANWFHDRGLPILGDDVCVVRDDASGMPVVEPGLPRIRLWADALQASGRDAADYKASFDDMDKYDVPIAVAPARAALPLAAIYTLHAAEAGQRGSIDKLAGAGVVEALVANTYRGAYITQMGGVAHHLAQCVALARQVPVFALHRRWGLELFAEEAASVEAHVRRVLNA